MLTHDDIKLLQEVFPTREEVASKNDIEEIKGQLHTLTSAVDSFAKESLKNFQEINTLTDRLEKTERNVEKVAAEVNIKLEY